MKYIRGCVVCGGKFECKDLVSWGRSKYCSECKIKKSLEWNKLYKRQPKVKAMKKAYAKKYYQEVVKPKEALAKSKSE